MSNNSIMNGELNKKNLWDSAGKGGLILGGITIGFLLLSYALELLPDNGAGVFIGTLLNFVIWAAKFIGCIYVLYRLMKKFAADFPTADKTMVRKFGFIVGGTSALIVSAFTLVYMLYISPESFEASIETAMQAYSGMLDSNSMEALESMSGKMPAITFFSQFIYCTLFGIVASAIIAGKIKPSNPFTE